MCIVYMLEESFLSYIYDFLCFSLQTHRISILGVGFVTRWREQAN